MSKTYTVSGVGICLGDIIGLEKLIQAMISDAVPNDTPLANSASIAVQEALKYSKSSKLELITDELMFTEQLDKFGFSSQVLCNTLSEMLAEADGKNAILLTKSEFGNLAMLFTDDDIGYAKLSFEKSNNDYDEESLPISDIFLSIITAVTEVRFALKLTEPETERYLVWDSTKKREKKLDIDSHIVTVTEPDAYISCKSISETYLFPLRFDTIDEARALVDEMKKNAEYGMYSAMLKQLNVFSQHTPQHITAIFRAKDYSELCNETELFAACLRDLNNEFTDWHSENGSICISSSINNPKMAFINPSPNMFNISDYYSLLFGIWSVLPRPIKHNTPNMLKGNDELPFSSLLFDITKVRTIINLLDEVGLRPDIISGIGLGELSLILPDISNGSISENQLETLKEFLKEIYDPLYDILASDSLPLEIKLNRDCDELASFLIKVDRNKLDEILKSYESVFNVTVCSYEDIIITGERNACESLISKLNCPSYEIDESCYAHTPIATEMADNIKNVIINNEWGLITPHASYQIFGSGILDFIDSNSEKLGNNISKLLSDTVNYVSVVNKLYENGVRVFITSDEICGEWLRSTLGERFEASVITLYSEKKAHSEIYLDLFTELLKQNISFDVERFLEILSFEDDTKLHHLVSPKDAALEILDHISVPRSNTPDANLDNTSNEVSSYDRLLLRQLEINRSAFKMYLETEHKLFEQALKATSSKNKSL